MPRRPRDSCDDCGAALLLTILAAIAIAAIAGALVVLTNTEGAIAGAHRAGLETLYAADAAIAHALGELDAAPSWDPVLTGSVHSSSFDSRAETTTAWNERVDIGSLSASWRAEASAEPFGSNNPVWRLYASGDIDEMMGLASVDSPAYVIVWVADDTAEVDADPSADSNGVIVVRAAAIGRAGARRVLQASVRRESGRLRALTWRELR